ncbi:MAG TPA: SagB/ThcOx family dehydrogenase [bacterium]|nr:SagB/ThcOx family dehydrogenase [bacterium]HQP98683.1 SagB/ThcOx family dehydrogenase [bacterium]
MMFGTYFSRLCFVVIVLSCFCFAALASEKTEVEKIKLPEPRADGAMSLEKALWERRSIRSFSSKPAEWEQVGQLLWAAQGINRPGTKFRTAPSAGATYPLEIYAVLPSGIYRYLPEEHAVERIVAGDTRAALSAAGLRQGSIQQAACVVVICAVFERTSEKYSDRGTRFVYLEAGHVAQNVLLQAVALGMGGVPIGAMVDEEAQKVLGVPPEQKVVYIVATGFPQ